MRDNKWTSFLLFLLQILKLALEIEINKENNKFQRNEKQQQQIEYPLTLS